MKQFFESRRFGHRLLHGGIQGDKVGQGQGQCQCQCQCQCQGQGQGQGNQIQEMPRST